MYKSRVYLWIIILLIFATVKYGSQIDNSKIIKEKKQFQIEFDTDVFLKDAFMNYTQKYIEFINSGQNPDIIIKNHSDEEIEGFEKLENTIYTPLVLYIPTSSSYTNTNQFYHTSNNRTYVLLKKICDAIVEDKTMKDLEISDSHSLKDKKIYLNIPSSDSIYYEPVIEQIYICLNNNKVPTEQEKDSLKEYVNKLLSKTVTCNGLVDKISETDTNDGYNIYLFPETNLTYVSAFSTSAGFYKVAHFEKTVAISYDTFVKQDNNEENDVLEYFNKNIIENPNFCKKTNYRTSYSHNYSDFERVFVCNTLDIHYLKR